jgi:hypothetical protein
MYGGVRFLSPQYALQVPWETTSLILHGDTGQRGSSSYLLQGPTWASGPDGLHELRSHARKSKQGDHSQTMRRLVPLRGVIPERPRRCEAPNDPPCAVVVGHHFVRVLVWMFCADSER